jgi:threonine dehydratase
MRGFGAEVVEFGDDFDTAKDEAFRVAAAEGLHIVPPFHPALVRGVATWAWELLSAQPDLHTLYVPIGCGSGICGAIAARDALGLSTRIVGVVSDRAPTAKLSAEACRPVPTDSAATFADGMAVRVPVPEALDIYARGAERIVAVGDEAVAEAIRLLFAATHNAAEGAGAAALAALMAEAGRMAGRKVGVVLSGGNIDSDWLAEVLAGGTPRPR